MEDAPFGLILADMAQHTILLVDGNTSEITAELPYPPAYRPQSFVPAPPHAVYITATQDGSAGGVLKLALAAPTLSVLTAALPAAPTAAAWDAERRLLFVAHAGAGLCNIDEQGTVTPLDGQISGEIVGLIATGGLLHAAIVRDAGGALLTLDETGRAAAIWEVAGTPTNLHLTPDKHTLAMPFTATAFTGEGLITFPLAADGLPQAPQIIHIQCSSMVGLHAYPCYAAFSADSRLAYVVNEDCATISVLNLAAHTAGGCIPIGRSISELHLRPDGRLAFATSHLFADLTVIDLVNGRPLAASALPQEIYGRMCLVNAPLAARR